MGIPISKNSHWHLYYSKQITRWDSLANEITDYFFAFQFCIFYHHFFEMFLLHRFLVHRVQKHQVTLLHFFCAFSLHIFFSMVFFGGYKCHATDNTLNHPFRHHFYCVATLLNEQINCCATLFFFSFSFVCGPLYSSIVNYKFVQNSIDGQKHREILWSEIIKKKEKKKICPRWHASGPTKNKIPF